MMSPVPRDMSCATGAHRLASAGGLDEQSEKRRGEGLCMGARAPWRGGTNLGASSRVEVGVVVAAVPMGSVLRPSLARITAQTPPRGLV
eukprot:scaffold2825_cov111-Isochrysis_galbana.AAC.7